VTSQVSVKYGGFVHVGGSTSKSAYQFTDAVTIKNTGSTAISGPIYLEVSLQGATLANASGTSQSTGFAYILVSNSALAVGASMTVTLELYDPTLGAISLNTKQTTVWAGGPPP
jgi:hypothetical protein